MKIDNEKIIRAETVRLRNLLMIACSDYPPADLDPVLIRRQITALLTTEENNASHPKTA